MTNSIDEKKIIEPVYTARKVGKPDNLSDLEEFSSILDKELIKTRERPLDQEKAYARKKQKAKNQTEDIIIPGTFNINETKTAEHLTNDKKGQASSESGKTNKFNNNVKDELPASSGDDNASVRNWLNPNKSINYDQLSKLDLARLAVLNNNKLGIEKILKEDNIPKIPGMEFKELFNELVKDIKSHKDGEITRLKLELKPEKLGRLDIYFVLDKDKLYISFGANEETKNMLKQNEAELKNLLTGTGYSLGDLNFSSQPGQGNPVFPGLEKSDSYNEILNNPAKKDIILQLDFLVSKLAVNYIA